MSTNLENLPGQFKALIPSVSGHTDNDTIYKKKRICNRHVTEKNKEQDNQLNAIPISTLFLNDKPCVEPVELTKECSDTSLETRKLDVHQIQLDQGTKQIHVCRICLQKDEHNINLFSEEQYSKDILEKICTCFQIVLHYEKYLPSGICSSCIKGLIIAYNFRANCVTSEERFLSYCKDAPWMHNNQISTPVLNPKIEDCLLDSNEDDDDDNIYNTPNDTDENSLKVESYECTICTKRLKSKESLLKHNVSMHQKRKYVGKVTGFGESRRYHCTKCSYYTPHHQTLTNHMRRHTGDRPYHCECGKSFTQTASLAAHRKTHSNVMNYTCATCGKQFKHTYALKKHLRVHETGKFFCDICHKNLKSNQSLQDHMHRHYNIRNFNCEDCGDTFVTCSELLNHKKKHSSVKELSCHMCGYKTNIKKNLVIHVKRHAGDKRFNCGLCEMTFYTSGDVRRHHRVHTRDKPFECGACAHRFTHSTSLNKHMQKVHGLDYKWGESKFKELKRNKKVQMKAPEDM